MGVAGMSMSGAAASSAGSSQAGVSGPGLGPAAGDGSALAAGCDPSAALDVGPAPLRRLTQLEYAQTLQYLLQLPEPPDVSAVPAEVAHDGFTVHSALQTFSAQHLRGYLEVATRLASALLQDRARQARVIGCTVGSDSCLESFTARFGRLAYRRPLSSAELQALLVAAQQDGATPVQCFELVIEALLISPNFLYRTELGSADPWAEGPQRLTDYELAARLSYALLGRGPSGEILDQVADGALQTEPGQAALVAALIAEGGFPEFYASFFGQWLGFDQMIRPKDPPIDWDDGLLEDMQTETQAVVERFAWSGDDFRQVLTTDQTWLTPRLAAFYGLPTPTSPGWIEVPVEHPRAGAGLLGHAALLSKKSDGDPVALRGNWLRRTFMCRNLEIPEAVAAMFGERLVGLTRTQIVRERNSDNACRGCHALIDPIGVGLDVFDDTGRIDPDYIMPDYGLTPALPDAANDPEFENVAALSRKLQALPEVASCLTARAFLFTHGREPGSRDRCAVGQAEQAFIASGYNFRRLIEGLVSSPAFQLRRAPSAANASGEAP